MKNLEFLGSVENKFNSHISKDVNNQSNKIPKAEAITSWFTSSTNMLNKLTDTHHLPGPHCFDCRWFLDHKRLEYKTRLILWDNHHHWISSTPRCLNSNSWIQYLPFIAYFAHFNVSSAQNTVSRPHPSYPSLLFIGNSSCVVAVSEISHLYDRLSRSTALAWIPVNLPGWSEYPHHSHYPVNRNTILELSEHTSREIW